MSSTQSGGINALNTKTLFNNDATGNYGIPILLPSNTVPLKLVPFGTEVRRQLVSTRGGCCHFFLDDYRFECIWNSPERYIELFKRQGQILTPDFSLFMDYPKALQIFNTYRNRWIGRFMQEHGVDVIPTVAWSDHCSYDYAFTGIPKHNTVAVSTVGVLNSEEAKERFLNGFRDMYYKLEPSHVLIYGKTYLELEDFITLVNLPTTCYDSYWVNKKRGNAKNDNEREIAKRPKIYSRV